MIKATTALATAPLFANKTFPVSFTDSPGVASFPTFKRFGDGRDWFFEKHFGLFIH